MTLEEAIKHAKDTAENRDDLCMSCRKEHARLAEWLEELKQYRAIGTLEECRAAVEKQKAQTPDFEGDGYSDGQIVYDTWICPGCGEHYEVEYDRYEYCPNCGQKISWEGWEDDD